VYDFACGSSINRKRVQRPCPCSARFDSVARSAGIYLLLPAIPGSANASMANRFAGGKCEAWALCMNCPHNFADIAGESNFPHRPSRTSAIVLPRSDGSVVADK
jgi:hypothetical protein